MNYIAIFNKFSRQIEFDEYNDSWNPNTSKPLAEIVPDTQNTIVVGFFSDIAGPIWVKPPEVSYDELTSTINNNLRNGFVIACPGHKNLWLIQDFSHSVLLAWEEFKQTIQF